MKYIDSESSEVVFDVAPLAGARIEIKQSIYLTHVFYVAPLAGARIEICYEQRYEGSCKVAPLAGARIEIPVTVIVDETNQSLPSRERGLKFEYDEDALENLGRSPRGSAD